MSKNTAGFASHLHLNKPTILKSIPVFFKPGKFENKFTGKHAEISKHIQERHENRVSEFKNKINSQQTLTSNQTSLDKKVKNHTSSQNILTNSNHKDSRKLKENSTDSKQEQHKIRVKNFKERQELKNHKPMVINKEGKVSVRKGQKDRGEESPDARRELAQIHHKYQKIK